MPITPYLDGHKFDPETMRVMGVAFKMTRVALGLADRGGLANVRQTHHRACQGRWAQPRPSMRRRLEGTSRPAALGRLSCSVRTITVVCHGNPGTTRSGN
jgi:hypothetical protein